MILQSTFPKCFLGEYLLSGDEAQEPGGEQAVTDDKWYLGV